MRYSDTNVYDLQLGLQQCQLYYKARVVSMKNFTARAQFYYYFSKEALKDEEFLVKHKNDPNFTEALELSEGMKIFDNTKGFMLELLEKSFIESYQILEYFLYDCYYYFFCTYPKLIWHLSDDKRFDMSYDSIFKQNDWNKLRHDVIDNFVRKIGYKSIKEQILFCDRINVKLRITDEELNNLAGYSFLRNNIIHNNSFVTNRLIYQLKQINLKNPFIIETHLFIDYQEYWNELNFENHISQAIEMISEDVLNSKGSIDKWYNSLKY